LRCCRVTRPCRIYSPSIRSDARSRGQRKARGELTRLGVCAGQRSFPQRRTYLSQAVSMDKGSLGSNRAAPTATSVRSATSVGGRPSSLVDHFPRAGSRKAALATQKSPDFAREPPVQSPSLMSVVQGIGPGQPVVGRDFARKLEPRARGKPVQRVRGSSPLSSTRKAASGRPFCCPALSAERPRSAARWPPPSPAPGSPARDRRPSP
jgi:hypothetical protein